MMRLHGKVVRVARVMAATAVAVALALGAAVASLAGTAAAAGTSGERVSLRAQLGIIYAQNGQTEEARKEFVKLLEEPMGRATALTNLGNIAILEGKTEVAIENYTQAAALDTLDGGILLDLGLAYKQIGRDEDAARAFEQALNKAGGMTRAAYLLGLKVEGDTSKGKVTKLTNEEIKSMLAKAKSRVPDAQTGGKANGKEPSRTQVASRPGGARAAEVAVGPTSLYWKEK